MTARPPRHAKVTVGSASIEIHWRDESVPATPGAASTAEAAVDAARGAEPVRVSAPLVGTFHRAPGPDAAPLVEVGDVVHTGQQICFVETVKVLVADGEPVEYGQPLLELEPVAEQVA